MRHAGLRTRVARYAAVVEKRARASRRPRFIICTYDGEERTIAGYRAGERFTMRQPGESAERLLERALEGVPGGTHVLTIYADDEPAANVGISTPEPMPEYKPTQAEICAQWGQK